MFYEVLLDIAISIITAILVSVFSQLFNVKAKEELKSYTTKIKVYIESLCVNAFCGVEEKKEDYYMLIENKANIILYYTDCCKKSIRLFNCINGNRNIILKQLNFIEESIIGLITISSILGNSTELQNRLNEFFHNYQLEERNILEYNNDLIMLLLDHRKRKALSLFFDCVSTNDEIEIKKRFKYL